MNRTHYDVVVVGGGHNGLVAASYLARAGRSVLVLEKLPTVGGAVASAHAFDGVDAALSRYSYLVSLLPDQIVRDLDLRLELRSRSTASYTPVERDGRHGGLYVEPVGADGEGERILAALRDAGVDVSGVQVLEGHRSGASVVVVDAGWGTRAICTRPVPPLTIPTGGPAAALLARAAWVHADHQGWEPLQAWLAAAGDPRPRVSVDAGNPVPGFTPGDADLYVPTVEALARRYGRAPVDQLLGAALRDGASTVVATRGGDGAVAATRAGARAEVPGHAVAVRSTLGAGDVFHGALLAALVRDLPLAGCLRYANTAAALSCRGLDGRSAIPTHGEVLAAMAPAGETVPLP